MTNESRSGDIVIHCGRALLPPLTTGSSQPIGTSIVVHMMGFRAIVVHMSARKENAQKMHLLKRLIIQPIQTRELLK